MVLSTYDDSPLALLRLARSEAEAELRRSLAKASMLALTLCVSVLLARALFFAPVEFRIIDLPTIDNPTNRALPPVIPTGAPPPPRVAQADPRGDVLPVERVDPAEPDKMVPPEPGIPVGPDAKGVPGEGAPTPGPAVPARPVEPDPKEFVYYEVLPQATRTVKPDYPPIAQQAGMEGKVVVRMLIDVDGSVRRAEIETSSAMFDNDALEAARKWRFSPALSNGKPVMAWVRVPFDFRLH